MSDQVRISHALNLLSNLENMKEKEIVCDFTIKVGNKSFPVHRAVLVATSDYFGGMFSSNMKEVQEGRVEMKNLGVKGIQQSVEFMYTGTARINIESVQDILHVADLFQLDGLKGLCFQFLIENLSPHTCLSVVNLAEIYGRRDVKEEAEQVVAADFEAVISSEMFPSISRSDLLRYISSVSYQISWKAAITWAEDKEEFPQLIEGMDIRKFPIIFLLETVLEEPLVKKSDDIKSLVVSALFSDAEELEKNLDAVNCIRFNILAKARDVDEAIHDVISRFMKKNFEEVATKAEFCDVDKDDVLGLFRSEETKYSSETVKWQAALEWVKHDTQSRKKVFAELFSLIKLEDLTLEFLKGTVREESLVKDSRKCSDALMDAFITKAKQLEKQLEKPGVQEIAGAQAMEEPDSASKVPFVILDSDESTGTEKGSPSFQTLSSARHSSNSTGRAAENVSAQDSSIALNYRSKGSVKKCFGRKGSEPGCLDYPCEIAVTADDKIVVADRENNRIQIFDRSGNSVRTFGRRGGGNGELKDPWGVCVTTSDQIVVADTDNNRIQVFSNQGRFMSAFGQGKLSHPWSVATNCDGSVFVADDANSIKVFSLNGDFIRTFGESWLDSMDEEKYLTFAHDNKVIVSEHTQHRIGVFDEAFQLVLEIGTEGGSRGQFKYPCGVACDRHGNIIIVDSENNRIQVFEKDGNFIKSFGSEGSQPGQMDFPRGVAVLRNGDVVVSDTGNNRIQIF